MSQGTPFIAELSQWPPIDADSNDESDHDSDDEEDDVFELNAYGEHANKVGVLFVKKTLADGGGGIAGQNIEIGTIGIDAVACFAAGFLKHADLDQCI